MKKIVSALAIILCAQFAFAQDYNDVLRYSQFQYTGSARSISMGNAFGALGGDFTSASINPAGLGLYRSFEVSFSPSFGKIENDATYLGNATNDGMFDFNFNNLGLVLNFEGNPEKGVTRTVFGFGMNRLNNLTGYSFIEGHNAQTSLLDYFTNYANSGSWDEFNEKLAYDADLMPFDTINQVYWNDINEAGYGQSQSKVIDESGRTNEWSFALAVNMNEKINIGVALGLVDIKYNSTSEFMEWDANNGIEYFNEYKYIKGLDCDGFGVNAKIGLLYRPTKALRLGASIHTPTFLDMDETYYSDMVQTNDYNEKYEASSPLGEYSYKIETPMRTILSAAYSIGDFALISGDWEHVNYTSSRLRRSNRGSYNFNDENQVIKNYLEAANNFRIGAEVRATSNFSLRAGYEFYGNPYTKQYNNNDVKANENTHNALSFGVGYRQKNFFADIAYRANKMNYFTEVHPGSDYAEINNKDNSVFFTVGFKFN